MGGLVNNGRWIGGLFCKWLVGGWNDEWLEGLIINGGWMVGKRMVGFTGQWISNNFWTN